LQAQRTWCPNPSTNGVLARWLATVKKYYVLPRSARRLPFAAWLIISHSLFTCNN
jgi:hypothetical protein